MGTAQPIAARVSESLPLSLSLTATQPLTQRAELMRCAWAVGVIHDL
jgi:hypothetical protein